MDLNELGRGFQQLWDNKPGAVVLFVVGFVVFVFLVVDTWVHRHRRKRQRPQSSESWRP